MQENTQALQSAKFLTTTRQSSAAHPGAAGRRPSFPPKVSGVLFPMWGGCYGVVAGGSGAGAAPSTELQS